MSDPLFQYDRYQDPLWIQAQAFAEPRFPESVGTDEPTAAVDLLKQMLRRHMSTYVEAQGQKTDAYRDFIMNAREANRAKHNMLLAMELVRAEIAKAEGKQ